MFGLLLSPLGMGGLLFNLLGAGFDIVFGLIGGAIFKARRVIA
ncbi:MAG TPA: hypothetical protein VFY25_12885 [Anaerolineales bacterium]|nr:hypothetical protein [Anaerolineales bacterium]